jgi:hypothetical protein
MRNKIFHHANRRCSFPLPGRERSRDPFDFTTFRRIAPNFFARRGMSDRMPPMP